MTKWHPRDIIALVVILVCGGLMMLGYNHLISYTFAAVIAAYVGVDIGLRKK